MKLYKRPNSGVLTVKIQTPEGERIVSTGTTDTTEAREILEAVQIRKVAMLAKAGTITRALIQKLTIGGNLTVQDAFDQWSKWLRETANSDRTAENHITFVSAWLRERHLAKHKIHTITAKDISAWINDSGPSKLGSRMCRLASVRCFFKFCSARSYVDGNPAAEVRVKVANLSHDQKEPNHRQPFTEDEFKKLTDYLACQVVDLMAAKTAARRRRSEVMQFWMAATIIGRYSGLRLGDICCLEWASLKEPWKIIVWTAKSDARVEIPVCSKLMAGLAQIPENKTAHCFPEQSRVARDPKKRQMLSVQFGRILAKAGVHGHSFHDLRHTLATELKVKGSSLEEIAKALGHASTSTTEGYVH